MKAFDRDKLFEISESKNISYLLLKKKENYSGNKINVKISNQLSKVNIINNGFKHGCPLSPTRFNIYMNEIIIKCNHIYTKSITLSSSTKIKSNFYRRTCHNGLSRRNFAQVFILQNVAKILEWKYHQKN
jgi:hypothetical protein